MALSPPVVNTIVQVARAKGVNPVLALATALNESGLNPRAVGDQGSSFGLYQLHRGGELGSLTPGQAYDPATNARVALGTLAAYAGRGQYGSPGALAAAAQRPANPAAYAAAVNALLPRARALLAGTGGLVLQPGPPAQPQPLGRAQPLRGALTPSLIALLNANRQTVGLPELNLAAVGTQPPRAVPAVREPRAQPVGPAPRRTGRTLGYLEHVAAPFDLTVTSTTGGRHAKNSYHYKGRAADFAGDPARMAALARYALAHPKQFVEVIYTGPGATGYSILAGKVIPNTQLAPGLFREHQNHVHLAR